MAGDCTGHQGREIAGVDSLNAKDNNGKHGGQTGNMKGNMGVKS